MDISFAALNLDTNLFVGFSSFAWLTCRFTSKNLDAFFKALVATTAWIIWKDRCNLVFNGWAPKFHSIFPTAWSYCTSYFNAIGKNHWEFSNPYNPSSLINLYTDASWTDPMACSGLGFIATTNSGLMTDSPIVAVNLALGHYFSRGWLPHNIFSDCPNIAHMLKHFNNCVAWPLKPDIDALRLKLNTSPFSDIITINREENQIVDALANHARSHPHLSLFFQGLDRPRWLEELCRSLNLFFNLSSFAFLRFLLF